MEQKKLEELDSSEQNLIEKAIEVRKHAYAPYSGYSVGSALLDCDGKVFSGCNVEGADYTLTTHAEMDAINSMVKSGSRKIKSIAVVVKSDIGYGMPCGLCRQKIREFALNDEVKVIGVNLDNNEKIREIFISKLSDLLPFSFGPDFL